MTPRVVERNKDISSEIVDYASNKVQRIITKLQKNPIDLKLNFSKEHHENVFQIHLVLPKSEINIKTSGFDQTSHIDMACDKLERKLAKHFKKRVELPPIVEETEGSFVVG